MATLAGLPDPTQVSSADAAARLAAAQAANLAWRTNTAPVLPRMGAPAPGSPGTEQDLTRIYVGGTADVQGTPMDLTRSQYIAQFGRTPEEAESAKHMEHFHPAEFFGTTMDAMQGMTLGQIASRYGSRAADYVQDYSREHPSARFQAITQAYEAQQQRTVSSGGTYVQPTAVSEKNPYDPNSAAGIAWLVGRQQGGTVTSPLAEKAAAEERASGRLVGGGVLAGVGVISGTETIPIRSGGTMQTIEGRTIYVPYGEHAQQELLDTKYIFDPIGGRIGIYQKPASIFEGEGFKRIYGIEVASGSTGALQSGMFTLKPATADIRTQWLPETFAKTADVGEAAKIRAAPEQYSRLGAEVYGGIVTRLDGRVLTEKTQMGRYPAETGNLANLVDPFGVNKPKSELQATEPWSIEWGTAPVFQQMSGKGFEGTTVKEVPAGELAKVGIYPVPFISKYEPVQQSTTIRPQQIQASAGGALRESGIIDKVSVFLSGASTKADELLRTDIYSGKVLTPEEQSAATKSAVKDFGFTGGIIGQTLWGEKSPEVIKGFAGSVGDFAIGVATLGQWQPFKEKMQQTDVGQQEYLKQKAAMESDLALPESYQKDVGAYEKAKSEYDIKLADYSTRATAYQSGVKTEAEYNKLMEEKAKLDTEGSKLKIMYSGLQSQNIGIEQRNKAYDEFIKQGVSSGYLKYTGKGEIEVSTTKTYDYGEYSKAGASLGTTFRSMMGFSEEQLEAYGTVVENKPIEIGPWYDPLASVREKIVYGTGKVVSTHPEKIATAYGGGGVLVVGGGVAGGALEAAGAGTGATATAARGVLAGGKYVLPVVFTGAMGYSVTEGGKASAGKTLINVGEMFPEAAGAALGGGSIYLISGSNLPIGFGTKKTEYVKGYEPIQIDLTGKYPQTRVGAPKGTTEYPSTLPSDLRVAEPEPFIQIGGTRLGKGALEQAKTIERVPAGAEVPFETVPATSDIVMSEAMLNIKSEKVFIRKTGGDVVGAVGYAEGPEGIFIKAIGSTEKGTGVGSALIGEVKGIARERGVSKITGEATTESMGFWEKQGAVIRTEPGKSLHPFEIDVGKSTPLSGTEMGSVSESTQLGFLDLGKSRTSAQYSMDQMVADFNRYSQQPSASTSLLWEKQASLWKSPQPTGILPMDLLPGTGRVGGLPLTEMSWGKPAARPLSGEMPVGEVSLEFLGKGIGKSTERGLTISGAGMSQQMLESVVTKGGIKAPTSYLSNIDVLIQKGTTISRVKPAVEAAKQQKIVPSATEATFGRTSTISARNFEDALLGIIESEKRAPVKTTTKKIPKGMQMDYLRDALKRKTTTIEISGRKKTASQPTQAAPVVKKPTLVTPTVIITPKPKTTPVSSTKPITKPSTGTKPVTKPVTTPVQKPVNIFKPKQKPQQKQTPYVAPKTGSKQSQQQIQTTSQKQTPYVAPALPTPVTPTTAKPEKPGKQTPYVPPVLVTPPTTPKTPGTAPSTTPDQPKPIIPPPVIPFGFNFNLPSGGGGGGGYRKGSRAYVETLGLVSKQFDPFRKSKAKPRKKSKWSF